VTGSLIAFVIVYFAVFAAGTWYILKMMAHAPTAHEPPLPDAPIRSAGITPARAVEEGRR
jgi:cytochrome d ubiquinol oxidase subunit I